MTAPANFRGRPLNVQRLARQSGGDLVLAAAQLRSISACAA